MSIKRRILGPIIFLMLIGVVGASWISLAAVQTQNEIEHADSETLRTLRATERAQRILEESKVQLHRFLEFNSVTHPSAIAMQQQKFVAAFEDVWAEVRAAEGSQRQKEMVARVEQQFNVWNTEASIALGLIPDSQVPSHSRLNQLAERLELSLVALEQQVRLSAAQANQTARRGYIRQVAVVFVSMIAIFLLAGSAFLGFGSQLAASLTRLGTAMERIRSGDYDTTVRDLCRQDEVGQIARGVSAFCHTLRDLSTAKSRIEHLALHDQLTNLPNRRALQEHLSDCLDADHKAKHRTAVLHVDLDRFKQINDLLGHAAGDEVLRHAARAMLAEIREGDMTARVGGDEFVIVLQDTKDAAQVEALALRIIEAITQPIELWGEFVNVGASIGIAFVEDTEKDPARVLSNADIALYVAKSEGRGRASFYNDATRARFEGNMALLKDLRAGLDNGEIMAFYQPQVDGRTGEILGFEALARWQHPERGMLDPGVFITLAFEHGLGDRLTATIVTQAIAAMQDWRKRGLPAPNVSVNFSAKQLRDGGLVEFLDDALFAAALQPEDLNIEVLESVLFGDGVDPALNTIAKLQKRGYKIELDDFGTGHASISNLRRFKVDGVKIDRDFISGVDQDAEQEMILRTLIDLCRNLDIECLAEGVETEAEMDKLLQLGCHKFQGYGIARPMPKSAVEDWLEDRRDTTSMARAL
ncbi:putative bifunctional diguanylate cyclase/phosphodiesterase [Tritonibacter horizontis]|uniref:Cyclic di-GMP phosphodiesterase Gmr n=1 Tax=Tritonibacter horizontis TaxID=1768241 RepID=A0A132BSV2_9RHOB|nr:EAL domain-containing protein [Tritonibacter horizontis]KUP91451.1 cyclic di-GMP phosphodiesterase Gmr [Tritonibacter horizontis]